MVEKHSLFPICNYAPQGDRIYIYKGDVPMGSFDDLFDAALAIPAEICRVMQEGNLPEGSRVYRRDILDAKGNKVGEKVVRTYSYGRNRPSKEDVRASFPPVNIYTDNEGRKTFEFACAGYDPKNISFEINKDDSDYIDLVLSSGVKTEEVKEPAKKTEVAKKAEDVQVESRAYNVEGFRVKDTRVPFYVDTSKFNIEEPSVEFENGVVRITFEPKKINFNPKFK